MNSYVPNQKIT